MSIQLGMFPVAPLMFALLIPIIYSLKWKRKELKNIILISLCSLGVVVFYPLVIFLSKLIPFGYPIGKIILFVLFPIITVFYIERWNIKTIFLNLGVRKRNLSKSIIYGLLATVITISITIFVSITYPWIPLNQLIAFLESFTEEFFFRGFLFLYLLQKTNLKVAYPTSILAFVLAHPQHFTSWFLISLISQGILLTFVAHKTKNIMGPFISHGLNRTIPVLIRNIVGL